MLWLLLTYLGYAAALGATVGAVGYVAVTRFGVVQRLLATVMDRTLTRIADTGRLSYSVTHTATGTGTGTTRPGGSGSWPAAQALCVHCTHSI